MNKESKLFSCDNSGIVYAQCISFPTESKTKNFTLACTVKVVAKALRKAKPGVEKKKNI